MFNGLHSEGEGAADHKSRAYCASVYGLFCFVGTFSAVVALFFKHGPLHLFAAVCYLAECVVALWFLVEALDQGPQTLQRLSHRAQLLMALCLVPNVAYLFVI
jgi:hypothetical protein